ncbi:MAG: hemolysin family protein [Terriglobia bacterium]
MALTVIWIVGLLALIGVSAVCSYLRLLMRRLSPVAGRVLFQENAGRRVQADRERVGVSLSALHGAAMALFSVGLTGLLVWNQPEHLAADLAISLLIVLGVIALFDQLIPFSLVARHDEPEVILSEWMPVLHLVIFFALPLTFPVLISTTIRRLLEPVEEKAEPPSPQEEFQELIEVGEKEGLIDKGEGEMLQSVVEFTEKVVREVMTPRPEIAAIEINSSIDDLRALFREKRQTRYPVYAGQLDHVEGYVSMQSLMELPPEEQTKATLRSLIRPVPFVPETKPVQDLLKELQQSTTQLAIVIDEYGSVSGLVTIEDLLEEIVGEIRDEVEPHAHDIVRVSQNTYVVAGNTELARVADQLNVDFETQDYSTVAGLITTELGHVPTRGEKVKKGGLTFEVLEADQRTVLKVRLTMSPATPAPAPAHAEPNVP